MSFIITMTAILILCVFLQVLNILNDLLKNSLHVWRALTGLQKKKKHRTQLQLLSAPFKPGASANQ